MTLLSRRIVPLEDQLLQEGKCAEVAPNGAGFCVRPAYHPGSHGNTSSAWKTFTVPQSRLHRELNRFTEEASTIGIRLGRWPRTIRIELEARGLEPAMPEDFRLVSIGRDADGDVTSVVYATRLRQTFLEVWND